MRKMQKGRGESSSQHIINRPVIFGMQETSSKASTKTHRKREFRLVPIGEEFSRRFVNGQIGHFECDRIVRLGGDQHISGIGRIQDARKEHNSKSLDGQERWTKAK
jgi:hypothetical protein